MMVWKRLLRKILPGMAAAGGEEEGRLFHEHFHIQHLNICEYMSLSCITSFQ